MTVCLRCLRRRRPAPDQTVFQFLLVWTPLEPPRPPPLPLPHGWWRKSREAARRAQERPGDRDGNGGPLDQTPCLVCLVPFLARPL